MGTGRVQLAEEGVACRGKDKKRKAQGREEARWKDGKVERKELKRIGWWGWKCDGDAAAVQVAPSRLEIMWPPYRYFTDFLQYTKKNYGHDGQDGQDKTHQK